MADANKAASSVPTTGVTPRANKATKGTICFICGCEVGEFEVKVSWREKQCARCIDQLSAHYECIERKGSVPVCRCRQAERTPINHGDSSATRPTVVLVNKQ